jgi:proton-translocating NADH-quinone oxidoreductase chain N
LNDLILLLPEIIITVAAFLIITLDIIWNGDERSLTILPWVAFAAAVAAILATLNAWPLSSVNNAIATDGAGAVPMLAVDPMALFFKILSALTVALVGLSSVDYLRAHTPFRGEFFGLTLLAGLSLMLMSSATNLVMIYLSVEFLSITSYILTTYLRTDARSTEAGLKYLLYGAVASGVMLYGFSLLYGATGSVDLATIAISIQDTANVPLIVAAVILILTGLGFKIALVPFHQCSPDAYEGAPTPITAFLSVGPKVAGFAVLIRILVVALPAYDFNWTAILVLISILTMTVGNLVALWQTNIKRLLAYSSIAQAGYMLIGLAAWSAQPTNAISGGVNGILLYLFAYVFTNLGLFAVVIILENRLGTANISDYAGLIRRSPFLSIALLVFFLSLIGIPPTGGFMGKLFVFSAAIDRGLYLLAFIGVMNSVVSVYYYFGIARLVFFGEAEDESLIQPSFVMNAVVAVTMIVTLLIALYGQPFIDFANNSTQILAATF